MIGDGVKFLLMRVIVLAVIMVEGLGSRALAWHIRTQHSYRVKGLIGPLKHSYLDVKGVCLCECLCVRVKGRHTSQSAVSGPAHFKRSSAIL